ncbi:MAG TPA: secretin N-terminal domain-containing protein [Blastocatellia bacterium]|jgi:hypothetical protein
MFSIKARIITAAFLGLSFAAEAFAQQAPEAAQTRQPAQTHTPAATQPAPQPSVAKEPEYVEEKGFKGRIFEIKYLDPTGLARVIQPLGSGFKGATISTSPGFRTLTVRDFPENIAAMEEAIKRLDVPEAPRADIEFHVHILIASDANIAADEVPAELNDVIKQLKATLKYKSYALMTSSILHAKERVGVVNSNGVAESKLFSLERPQGNPIFYQYTLGWPSQDSHSPGGTAIQLSEFRFSMRIPLALGTSNIQYENVGFQTPVSLREGEKVIVGTTTLGDKGLVVVLSAKLIK